MIGSFSLATNTHMSHILWKFYLEDNVEKFEAFLTGGHAALAQKNHGATHVGSIGAIVGSPGTGGSPRTTQKNRKPSGFAGTSKGHSTILSRAEVNSRDVSGLTLLHRVVSSKSESSMRYAVALIEHPSIDIYVQDLENGWTALHRSLYFGNIAIARLLLAKDQAGTTVQGAGLLKGNTLIKIKDHEGNSAFDVYNATIASRPLDHDKSRADEAHGKEDDASVDGSDGSPVKVEVLGLDGDEVFAFGSNKNLTLGFGDEDDRQYPERITLKRPEHLLRRLYREHVEEKAASAKVSFSDDLSRSLHTPISDLPALVTNRPIVIQDVQLSKLHSAVLTTDPESNLHMCGFGPGGRLGTGDEATRFHYVCIEGGALVGKKIASVALGQNHTMAISTEGELFTWGTNSYGQLGYSLPRPVVQDEEPINNLPRQVFGPMKRERIIGVAASGVHSVAHTSTSIFTWGKNVGQLGLMDSDSRSLEMQTVPRRVAASLFSAAIEMVSAIDRATIVLLANHSVCVFTNYGYNFVKFPLEERFSEINLHFMTTRYEPDSKITKITSGGDTIAAISSRGDLFTVKVSQNSGSLAASTTNPVKIKNALSQPQRIWSLRKGNWDGIKSVSVAENGSVILCTKAGAVYRGARRAKIKDGFNTSTNEFKKKDIKFQRVPGLTNVAAVRANCFGTFAAIRQDCNVTRTQIVVGEQQLWQDVAPLLILKDFVPSDSQEDDGSTSSNRFWSPALSKEHFDPFKRAVLSSLYLERDIAEHVSRVGDEGYDLVVSTTVSDTSIPVHRFMLTARSSVLRKAMDEFMKTGSYELSEILTIKSLGNRTQILLHGMDFITLLNFVLYVYQDTVVDVWHFTRHAPNSAYRFRQIRTELMKLATKLNMVKFETAVRLMMAPEPHLHIDLALAIQVPSFFDDGDTVIELDGGEMMVHSALLRQRCPFFDGIFGGRAGGLWLHDRREDSSDAIRIDMKHIEPSIFELVLRHLYADIGVELFDDIVASDLDELCEVIMDVLAAANELMLDRLSQICQYVLGLFVNTRNICQLVNVISPCAVTDFKDAGLEYLCLQLESMLENHLLDDLDDDLLAELDEVVRDNQLYCLPFAKNGRAELDLHEKYPTLVGELDEDRQRRIRDLAFRAQLRDDDHKLSSSFKQRVGSLDDVMSPSPQEKGGRRSRSARNAPFSPRIHPKDSSADLMFDMEDEDSGLSGLPSPRQTPQEGLSAPVTAPASGAATPLTMRPSTKHLQEPNEATLALTPLSSSPIPQRGIQQPSSNTERLTSSPGLQPWASKPLPSTKLDMREIMAQTSGPRTSSLSMSLSAQKERDDSARKVSTPKVSQKERKKQQQQAMQQAMSQSTVGASSLGGKPSSPWQVASPGPRTSLKDVLQDDKPRSPLSSPLAVPGSPIPALSLSRQRGASPDTRFAGQARSNSNLTPTKPQRKPSTSGPTRPPLQPQASASSPLVPHSRSYISSAATAEPSLQLSMADIIGQQKREQDLIKEAVAKRSLQEIQEEQAFQEWWDLESKRLIEEEAALARPAGKSLASTGGKGQGKGGKKSRGSGGAGRGSGSTAAGGRGRGGGGNPNEHSSGASSRGGRGKGKAPADMVQSSRS